jgi:predicted HicB family RNase H-like nuclease
MVKSLQMKSFKLRTISFTLAFAVLFSSTGFATYVHTCNFTQKKSYSLFSDDTCCASSAIEGKTTFSKSKCCSITKTLTKVSVNQANAAKLSLNFVVGLFAQKFQQYSFQTPLFLRDRPVILFANPPPISGKLLLALIQCYRI